MPVTTLTIPSQGTYVLDPVTGVITFTPALGFQGTATPVTYRITDFYAQIAASRRRAATPPRSRNAR